MNFKEIHLGQLIEKGVTESGIAMSRICNFFQSTEDEIERMYGSKSLDTSILLRWSKLLNYDFFRIYTQHLILYAPFPKTNEKKSSSKLPQFRKNVYTQEIIDFILDQIAVNNMTKKEVIEQYGIPKTTLYKWIKKHKK